MLPKKKAVIFLAISFLLLVGGLVWYFDLGFAQEKITYLFSPPSDKLVTKELTKEEIKSLAKIPVLRQLKTPLAPSQSLVQKKLEQADNVLLYRTEANDTTGRTMLVDTKQNIHYFAMGLGGVSKNFEVKTASTSTDFKKFIQQKDLAQKEATGSSGLVKRDFWREVGVFRAWARITKSKDFYAILQDPERNQDFLVRVNREKGACFPTQNETGLTDFAVQNISVTAERGVFDELGPLSLWTEKDLARLIKPQDLVVIYNQEYLPSLKNLFKQLSRRDTSGVVCADSLVIHRFNGKKQLEKELTRRIPDVKSTPMFVNLLELYYDRRLGKPESFK